MRRIYALAALAAALGAGSAAAGDPLAGYRWEKRPILVFAPSADDPRLEEQLTRLEAAAAALRDRRTEVIVDTEDGSALRRAFRPEGFAVVLVGLDGGEKFRSSEVVDPDVIFGRIDAMPMRRRELQRRGGGSE